MGSRCEKWPYALRCPNLSLLGRSRAAGPELLETPRVTSRTQERHVWTVATSSRSLFFLETSNMRDSDSGFLTVSGSRSPASVPNNTQAPSIGPYLAHPRTHNHFLNARETRFDGLASLTSLWPPPVGPYLAHSHKHFITSNHIINPSIVHYIRLIIFT